MKHPFKYAGGWGGGASLLLLQLYQWLLRNTQTHTGLHRENIAVNEIRESRLKRRAIISAASRAGKTDCIKLSLDLICLINLDVSS